MWAWQPNESRGKHERNELYLFGRHNLLTFVSRCHVGLKIPTDP